MKYTFVALSFFINIPTLYAASASSKQLTTSKKPIAAAAAKNTATKPTTQRKDFRSKPITTKNPGHKVAPTTNTVSGLMVVGKGIGTTTKLSTTTPDNDGDDFKPYEDDAELLMSQEELNSCGYWQAPLYHDKPIKLRIKATTQPEQPSTNAIDLSEYEKTSDLSDDDGELAFTKEQLKETYEIPFFQDPNPLKLRISNSPTDPKSMTENLVVVGKGIARLQPAADDTKTLLSDQNSKDEDNGPVIITGGVDLSDWPGLNDSDDSDDDDELGEYAKLWIKALYDPENRVFL